METPEVQIPVNVTPPTEGVSTVPTEAPAIIQTPVEQESGSGLPDGHVITTPEGTPDEKIVNEYDAAGSLIGWHKEPV